MAASSLSLLGAGPAAGGAKADEGPTASPQRPRIALIHALRVSIEPAREAFASLWPEARTFSLLDDSLSGDLAAAGSENAAIQDRFETLARYARTVGAEAILFTCSAFGKSIDRIKRSSPLPVLKPNDAMIEEALALGGRIGVLATFAPTLDTVGREFAEIARARGVDARVELRHVPRALEALHAGDGATHDVLIVEAARSLGDCAVIALAQFSMARARRLVQISSQPPVLASPQSAVTKLKTLVDQR